jgi:hypothetical protein
MFIIKKIRLWAPYWYQTVHKSTGFQEELIEKKQENGAVPEFNIDKVNLIRESLPFYEFLKRHSIGIDSLCPDKRFFLTNNINNIKKNNNEEIIIDHGLSIKSGKDKLSDPRNEHVLVWVGDRLLPRELAKVSVFDSSVQGGDAVWEGFIYLSN